MEMTQDEGGGVGGHRQREVGAADEECCHGGAHHEWLLTVLFNGVKTGVKLMAHPGVGN
jgi:hypothetical protein